MHAATKLLKKVIQSASYLYAKLMHESKKIITPQHYNAETDDFNWYMERGYKAARLVEFSGLAQAKNQEERFVWLINSGHLPGPQHQFNAAKEMKLNFALVPWEKIDEAKQ